MLLFLSYLLLPFINEVASFVTSDSTWRDMSNNVISVTKYCQDKNCVIKCCPKGEIIRIQKDKTFSCIKPIKKEVISAINDLNTKFLRKSTSDKILDTKKHRKLKVFINSEVCMDPLRTTAPFNGNNLTVYENGSSNALSCPEKFQYCVDLVYRKWKSKKNVSSATVPIWDLILVYKCSINYDPYANAEQTYIAVAMLISSFFMALVLIVYSMIRKIRQKIKNKILMAYLFSQICGYIIKSAQALALNADVIDPETCRLTSPAMYFFILSSCLWLNSYSFNLWWDLGNSARSVVGVPIRFRWFCLYAWGIPTVLTLFVVAVDWLKLYHSEYYKPPFDSCFNNEISTAVYLHGPIALTTAANCVLFLMTVYSMWMQKKLQKKIRRSKEKKNRFLPFKLSLMMGICWLLELIPNPQLGWYILVNLFHMFTGIFIFIIYVFKKKIIRQLCERLNIKSSIVDKIAPPRSTYYESSRKSPTRASHKSEIQNTSTSKKDTEMTVFKTIEKLPNPDEE